MIVKPVNDLYLQLIFAEHSFLCVLNKQTYVLALVSFGASLPTAPNFTPPKGQYTSMFRGAESATQST